MLDGTLIDAQVATLGSACLRGIGVGRCVVGRRAAVGLRVLGVFETSLGHIVACVPTTHGDASLAHGIGGLLGHQARNARSGTETLHIIDKQHGHIELLANDAFHGKGLLWRIAQAAKHHLAQSHLFLIGGERRIFAPSLHQHQHVEGLPTLSVVACKIVGGRCNEALQVAAKQQVGEHVAIVVRRVVGASVAQRHGNGHTRRAIGGGNMELDGLVRLIVELIGAYLQRRAHVVMVHEEETVGKHVGFRIEYHQLVDASGQLAYIGRNSSGALQALELKQLASAQHGVGGWCATTAAQGERRTLGVTVEGGILQFKHGAGFFSLG